MNSVNSDLLGKFAEVDGQITIFPPPWETDASYLAAKPLAVKSVVDRFFIKDIINTESRSVAKGQSIYTGDTVEFDLKSITRCIGDKYSAPTPAPPYTGSSA